MQRESSRALYIRNFVFGVEDSLVSTVGLLSGVAAAGTVRETVILTGIVLIFVEAFSMGVGSFLSEDSVEELEGNHEGALRFSFSGGLTMFLSYFIAGFIPLGPYLLPSIINPLPYSIGASLIALFLLGVVSGTITKTRVIRTAFRMFIIGGLAIALGVIVGILV